MRNTRLMLCRLLSVVLAMLGAPGTGAQTIDQSGCDATECFSPAFESAVVYQPPAGQYGITELMNAALADDVASVTALIEAGAEVNARDFQGATALLRAAVYGGREAVKLLLEAGADPGLGDNKGDTPLSMAVRYKNTETVTLLLQHGANPNVFENADRPEYRKPVLHQAAVTGQKEVVRLLVAHGADVREHGLEALNSALWQHHEDIVAVLLSTNIDVNSLTYDVEKYQHMQYAERVLQTAAQEGLLSSVELLIRNGANVNDSNSKGMSALSFAVQGKHPAIVTLLLEYGATVSAGDLAAALGVGETALVHQLLGFVDLTQIDVKELNTLISAADTNNDTKTLRMLFDARQEQHPPEPLSLLLYALADADECQIMLWDVEKDSRQLVLMEPGACKSQIFANRSEKSLYRVGDEAVSVYNLTRQESAPQSIPLPQALIAENLSDLKTLVRQSYGWENEWMTADIVQFGVLDSGDLAFAVHSGGPADETYGYVYALAGETWRLIDEVICHRFDDCLFDQIKGHAIADRPANTTIWHADIRLNPYFADKTVEKVVYSEDVGWDGTITFVIDGEQSRVHYSMAVGGHCSDNCAYTNGMRLQLPNGQEQDLASYAGNNAIVGRYALVAVQNSGQSQLVDLGTGESVLENLQLAGWIQ